MPRVLIVDDEPNIAELARLYLEKEGYSVQSVGRGEDALVELKRFNPDLVVLDLMLPDIDGFEICRRIRACSDTPVLMLTARREDVDKILGLEIGADDYFTKPFNPRELVARVKAILRRYKAGLKPDSVIEIGRLRISPARQEIILDGKLLKLRTKEFALLSTLAQHSGIVLSREKLLELVWGFDFYGETRTVDVHVNHLRGKIKGSGLAIETIRGTGYKLTSVPETDS